MRAKNRFHWRKSRSTPVPCYLLPVVPSTVAFHPLLRRAGDLVPDDVRRIGS